MIMLRHIALSLWAASAWTVPTNAMPTLQARTGGDLVNLLERATDPQWNLTAAHGSSILHPSDLTFATVTHRWSDWEAPTFSLAFVPTTGQDVAMGLKYMSQRNITFLAMSGGHGSSVTLKSVQSGVALSLTSMNKVTYDTAKKTITVGALSSACVGVGGCTVGGGHGWLRGKYGLVIDAIVSMRVALWDGTIVTASETQNSDLFWVMRGAGQNFGIMLEFTMKTWPQTNGGKIYNADMSFTNKSLEEVLETINGPVHQTMHAVSSGIESASNLPPLYIADPTPRAHF
ncbi:FAD-binding domain-containing protein [Apiospora saccharicola]